MHALPRSVNMVSCKHTFKSMCSPLCFEPAVVQCVLCRLDSSLALALKNYWTHQHLMIIINLYSQLINLQRRRKKQTPKLYSCRVCVFHATVIIHIAKIQRLVSFKVCHGGLLSCQVFVLFFDYVCCMGLRWTYSTIYTVYSGIIDNMVREDIYKEISYPADL